MISIDDELFTELATMIRSAYPSAYVANEYVSQPPRFPAIYIEESDNVSKRSTQTNTHEEAFSDVTCDFEVYSNKNKGKKAECKAISNMIDEALVSYGFTRKFLNPIPNMDDATIYRMRGRYVYTVSKDKIIYRR